MRAIICIMAASFLVGCQKEEYQLPLLAAEPTSFEVVIHAEGELAAVDSTPITVPASAGGPQTLAWIHPANAPVSKGQVVARFDASDYQIQASDAEAELAKLQLGMIDTERQLDFSTFELSNRSDVVDFEVDMAQRFNVENDMLYSRLEMIDAARNQEFLEFEEDYLGRMREHYETKTSAEKEVLDTQMNAQQAKLNRSQAGMSSLEIVAPHDGMFLYEKNWWGQEPSVGQTLFPGTKLAKLPDLKQMKARLYVPEMAGVGLTTDLEVQVTLDAHPDRQIAGKVLSVSQSAQPRQRENPVKYFTVDVLLNEADPNWIRPGMWAEAKIYVVRKQGVIAVPNQAIYQDNGLTWVYIQDGDTFIQKPVELGLRGQSRSELLNGVQPGDKIALVKPPEAHASDSGAG